MANSVIRPNHKEKVFHFVGILCLMLLLVQKGSGTQFTVGGSKGWTVPENTSTNSYNQWAENNRFQIDDSACKLIFILTLQEMLLITILFIIFGMVNSITKIIAIKKRVLIK